MTSLYIKRGKVSVRTYICNAGHGANDVIMRIAGLAADDTGRIYDNWRHVATGCNALEYILRHFTYIEQLLRKQFLWSFHWCTRDKAVKIQMTIILILEIA